MAHQHVTPKEKATGQIISAECSAHHCL